VLEMPILTPLPSNALIRTEKLRPLDDFVNELDHLEEGQKN